jgi:hypothetical protein
MIAATIHVQIIEFVTGKPSTLKRTGGAEGTFSSAVAVACAGAVEFAGLETKLPVLVCEDGCAFKFATKIAAKKAQTKKILLICFTIKTVKKLLPATPIAQLTKPIVGLRIQRLPHREKFHKHFFGKFWIGFRRLSAESRKFISSQKSDALPSRRYVETKNFRRNDSGVSPSSRNLRRLKTS